MPRIDPIRVLVADDSPTALRSVCDYLDFAGGMEVAARTPRCASSSIPKSRAPRSKKNVAATARTPTFRKAAFPTACSRKSVAFFLGRFFKQYVFLIFLRVSRAEIQSG